MSIKRNYKDSVFCHLFKIPEYRLQLYQALHPDDTEVREEDLIEFDNESVFTNEPYDDISFYYQNRMIVLVEAQTHFTENIALRMLFYASKHICNYVLTNKIDIHSSTRVKTPEVELYCVCTEKRKEKIVEYNTVSIKTEVRMIYIKDDDNSITNQYLKFVQASRDFIKEKHDIKEGIRAAIHYCIEHDILKSYLQTKNSEVENIMSNFLSQEQVFPNYIASIKEEGRVEGREEGRVEGREEGRVEGRIEGEQKKAVEIYTKHFSYDEAIRHLKAEFNISTSEAEELIQKYSKQ